MNKYELADKLNKFSENDAEYVRCEYAAMYDAEIKAEIEAEDWRKSENFFEFGHFDYEVEDESRELRRRYGTWCNVYRNGSSGWDDPVELEKEDKNVYRLDRYLDMCDSEVAYDFWYEATVGLKKAVAGEAFDFKIIDPYWYVVTAQGVAQETDPRIKAAYEERLAFYDGKLAQGCVYYDRLEHYYDYDDYDHHREYDEYDHEFDRTIASTAPEYDDSEPEYDDSEPEYDWTEDYEYEELVPVRNYPAPDNEFPSRRSKGKGPLGVLAREYADTDTGADVFRKHEKEAEKTWAERWQAAHDWWDSRPRSPHARGRKRAGTLRDHRDGCSARPVSGGADTDVWLEYEPETDSQLKNRHLPTRKPGWKNRQGLGLSRRQLGAWRRPYKYTGGYTPMITVYDHPWAGARTWHTGTYRHPETKELFQANEWETYKVSATYTRSRCRTCDVELSWTYVPNFALAKWGVEATRISWCVPCHNRTVFLARRGHKFVSPHHKNRNNF